MASPFAPPPLVKAIPKTQSDMPEPAPYKKPTSDDDEPMSGDDNGVDAKKGGKADNNRRHGKFEKSRPYEKRDDRRGDRRGGFAYDRKASFKPRNTEFDNLPMSSDPAEIRAQVEFYFSLQNLRGDQHLFHKIEGPRNIPVSIKHVADFKRMKRFQPYDAIVNALRDSTELVVLDKEKYSGPGNEAVQLRKAIVLPKKESDEKHPPGLDELMARLSHQSSNALEKSIYVSGLGDQDAAGQIALEKFFQPYGAIMVRKRRDKETNDWKGSLFVEFDSEDSQKQFLALDPKPTFNDNVLHVESKKGYSERKCKEKGIIPAWERGQEYTARPYNPRGRAGRGYYGQVTGPRLERGHGRGNKHRNTYRDRYEPGKDKRERSQSPRGDSDSNDWNERRSKFQQSKGYKGDRIDKRKEIERDENGVPAIKDTRGKRKPDDGDDDIDNSKDTRGKRKAHDDDDNDNSKKTKLEFKDDA
ncbi:hypothetical protein BDV95DRAFT_607923 [Massariosphaeria phaeospora]|uniref:HTH La-type RNA-binding domain-containing protein n=1 Tax=Massariosphaeria phaeospora TaxID=100035 RepID=A0A7C8I8H5_9PLEO|nr:hypothetical protein BDV95DRAFT_607923 [Massariosphaeria phaeospora]